MTGYTDDTVPSQRVEPERVRSEPATAPVCVWLLGFVVLLLVLTVSGLWALYLLRGQFATGGPTPTPVLWTPTPILWTPTPVASPFPLPTEPIPTTSPEIAIGRYVRVAGTEGHGLNLREGPGENYARVDVALEGQVFIVVDGPTASGGSEWWKVRDPENEEREWWAVGNFLEPVEL